MRLEFIGRMFQNCHNIAFHSHNDWEFVYYTDGAGDVYMNGVPIPFQAGDFFLIPPHTTHGERAESGFRNYHCLMSKCEFNTKDFIQFHDPDRICLPIMERIYLEFHMNMNRENHDGIMESLIQLLTQYILSFIHTPKMNAYVSKATTTILENLSNAHFSLDRMIAAYPFNSNYFMRLFHDQVGQTPLQFLTNHRIEYATRLIKTRKASGLSLKEIAQMAGYADYYYFSRVFKKVTGSSPNAWIADHHVD